MFAQQSRGLIGRHACLVRRGNMEVSYFLPIFDSYVCMRRAERPRFIGGPCVRATTSGRRISITSNATNNSYIELLLPASMTKTHVCISAISGTPLCRPPAHLFSGSNYCGNWAGPPFGRAGWFGQGTLRSLPLSWLLTPMMHRSFAALPSPFCPTFFPVLPPSQQGRDGLWSQPPHDRSLTQILNYITGPS